MSNQTILNGMTELKAGIEKLDDATFNKLVQCSISQAKTNASISTGIGIAGIAATVAGCVLDKKALMIGGAVTATAGLGLGVPTLIGISLFGD